MSLPVSFHGQQSPSKRGSTFNPTVLRKAKIVYNFGLPESSRVKEFAPGEKFYIELILTSKGGK